MAPRTLDAVVVVLRDIEITGHAGFYQIRAVSKKGAAFMSRVQGFAHGSAYSDQTANVAAIAEGALSKGLEVTLNGRYLALGEG